MKKFKVEFFLVITNSMVLTFILLVVILEKKDVKMGKGKKKS